MSKGSLYALGAYLIWGFFPIYFRLLEQAPADPDRCASHPVVIHPAGDPVGDAQGMEDPAPGDNGPMLAVSTIASILLTLNRLIYIFGVQAGFIVETSLGYYINPLVSVLLGVVFLRERLRPLQWTGGGPGHVGRAVPGNRLRPHPMDRVSLAMTFGLYGFAKKTSPLGSFYSLSMERG